MSRTIIGIDPGTNLLGFGVIDVVEGKPVFVDMGVLDIRKEKGSPVTFTDAIPITAPRWHWNLPSTARMPRSSSSLAVPRVLL